MIWLWHQRLGHPSFGYLKHLLPSLFASCNKEFKCSTCETCIFAKSHRTIFSSSDNKALMPFTLVHSDVWGPSQTTTCGGMRWFVTFIDDCTRITWIYLLKHKSDVSRIVKEFCTMVQTQFATTIKVLRSDNGSEYVNRDLAEFFISQGMIHQTSCPYTPQQNGVAERRNRQLLEVTRAFLIHHNVPKYLWGEALQSAMYVINRVPSSVLGFQTPLQVLQAKMKTMPPVTNLPPKVFGCVAYVHLLPHQRSKLDPCAIKCLFVGYASHQKGYRCYHPPTRKMFVTMDVTFHEDLSYFTIDGSPLQGENDGVEENSHEWLTISASKSNNVPCLDAQVETEASDSVPCVDAEAHTEDIIDDQEFNFQTPETENTMETPSYSPLSPRPIQPTREVPHEVTPETNDVLGNLNNNFESQPSKYQLPVRTNRGKPKPQYTADLNAKAKYPISNHVSTHRLSKSYESFLYHVSIVSIPRQLQDALADAKWTEAMAEEMRALQKNQTWDVVHLPPGKKTVGCRWIFTIKHKADGSVERYKARLVAKGYTQKYGVDYNETFAPVAKINTVRILLSLAANYDWPLLQYDVKNAFLHGELKEDVYMDLPPGVPERTGMVCRLKRALYGLKQSPRCWFGRFALSMRKFGYKQSNSDHTLFLKHKKDKVTALIIYVDDMILTGSDDDEIDKLKKYLSSEFEMKELGELKYFLGIEVARSDQGIFLSQRKYVLDLLTDTGMLGCKPADTPIEQNHNLQENPGDVPTNKERYQRLVGRLIYLSHTRPDIAYAVSVVSQFMHAPSERHMDAVNRILRYLKSTPGKGIIFTKNESLTIEGYTDADWAGDNTNRRSTSGYFTFVGGNLVTWRSKKQKVVSRSSAEAEYRAMAQGICELLWVKNVMKELGYKPRVAMSLYCDNKAAIAIAHNPVQHDRTKHVEVDRHFIKEKLEAHIIDVPFVKTEDQLADILTHAVSTTAFSNSLDKLGMRDIYAPT
ncbi:hypothetical protein ACE6H2_021318 [Prunus campanulata]